MNIFQKPNPFVHSESTCVRKIVYFGDTLHILRLKVIVMRKGVTHNSSLSFPPVITVACYIRPKNLLSTHIYYNRIGGTLMLLF